jgi:hypothetical protein
MNSDRKRVRKDSQLGLDPAQDFELQNADTPNSEAEMVASQERRFRNLYKKAPDFKVLSLLDPDFAP